MRSFLSPKRPLLDETVDFLAGRARTLASGAKSLAHLAVIVPTAQSGRRLREALAKRFGAVVPPAVMTPPVLVEAGGGAPAASRLVELATLAKILESTPPGKFPSLFPKRETPPAPSFRDALDLASSLLGVWRLIAENALSSSEVAAALEADALLAPANEDARWRDLAALEDAFAAALARRGLAPSSRRPALAIANPPSLDGVETVVLAGLYSPLPAIYKILAAMRVEIVALVHAAEEDAQYFDDFGRVKPGAEFLNDLGIDANDITRHPKAVDEAEAVRALYAASVGDDCALVIADHDFYHEAQSAFLMDDAKLYDPSRTLLSSSPLGRLAAQMVALALDPNAGIFAAFIRQGDVQRHLADELELAPEQVTAAIVELDKFSSEKFPRTLADIAARSEGDLQKIAKFVSGMFAPFHAAEGGADAGRLRGLIERVLGSRQVDVATGEGRELVAAATALGKLFDELEDAALGFRDAALLFSRSLEECEYQLEEDPDGTIRAEGWLELPFIGAKNAIVAAMSEGAVPESVTGHAFVPDSLRGALGLYTNEARAARDAFVLKEALACRAAHAVRLSFHTLAADSSILKPSRLLLRTSGDEELSRRAIEFYKDASAVSSSRPRTLPEKWRLDLPPPPRGPLSRISVTMLDTYLKCPFTYFLKTQFKTRSEVSPHEMNAQLFGTVAHQALETLNSPELADVDDAATLAAALRNELDAVAAQRFGVNPSALVTLQLEAIARRLEFFSACEARRRREGWRTIAKETPLRVRYGQSQTLIKGIFDRLDYNAATNELCVVDYKTWDKLERGSPFTTEGKEVAFAASRGIKLPGEGKAWKSLQLSVYCDMVETNIKELLHGTGITGTCGIKACYAILGQSQAETGFSQMISSEDWNASAKEVVLYLIDQIERGVFWPPSPSDLWRTDFGELFFDTPEKSMQREKVERLKG